MCKLAEDISIVLNKHSRESDSNTPDFILAEYLVACLCTFEVASNRREVWYGVEHEPAERYGNLYQLHWQFDDRTEMKAQFGLQASLQDNPNSTAGDELRKWIKEIKDEYPLPDGAQWLVLNEESDQLVWAAESSRV